MTQQGRLEDGASGYWTTPPGSFDSLAAHVIWDDAWYIIPAEVILGQARITVYPQAAKSKYARYREAWHLLGRADGGSGRIDSIQGCAEEFSAEWIE